MTEFLSQYVGRIEAKSGAVTWYETPTRASWPRRLKADDKGRLWIGEWHGAKVAMFDPKTEQFAEFGVKTPFSGMYDAIADKNGDVWAGGMSTDRIARINPRTGESVEYLLPDSTNVRRVFVDNTTTPVRFWVGSNHGAALVRVEPLE
jgi:streptogramin lyase